MVKLRTLLTVFIFTLKAEARDYGKALNISDVFLWCSANHNALWTLGLCRKRAFERGGA